MRLLIYVLVGWWVVSAGTVRANHLVGGQLEMRAVGDVPGHYKIIVINYYENGSSGSQTNSGQLAIFRKRDNIRLLTFTARETVARQPVVFSNATCASQRNLNFLLVIFEAEIFLTPSDYTDAGGYYLAYQTRNRNAGIDNISSPGQTGFTFYLEFPPLLQNGKYIENSSPTFGPINGEYVCINQPFVFPFGATDADGDELRYSLTTPLIPSSNAGNNQQGSITPAPYPSVSWLAGFDTTNPIPGKPTLSIDARTGQLSVTASQLGLFVFAINVEEYRNGEKIGEVHRDFQLLVVDCPQTSPPNPVVQAQNRPANQSEFTICADQSLTLVSSTNPAWNYQWRRDGVNLTGASGSSLTVNQTGDYTVVVSLNTQCSQSATTRQVRLNVVGSESELKATGHLCATTGAVNLNVTDVSANVTYRWFRDGQVLGGATANGYQTTGPGQFQAELTHTSFGCISRTNAVALTRSAAVTATLASTDNHTGICPDESLLLLGGGGTTYQWQRNGQGQPDEISASYSTKTAGAYSLTATDGFGCIGVSPTLTLTEIPPVKPTFEPVPSVCGAVDPALFLRGSPAGGIFAGPGVFTSVAGASSSQFSPKQAGIGSHDLTYAVRPAPECPPVIARQVAVVAVVPTIDLPDEIITYRGSSIDLQPTLTGDPVRFIWSPTVFLADPTVANAAVVGIQTDTTYTLRVETAYGCRDTASVHFTVYERIYIPDAFTPNGDGMNDVWELKGIEAFPEAKLLIYNRWGEVIYRNNQPEYRPFDGTLQGRVLPSGTYTYTLRPAPEQATMRGTVLLIR